MKKLIFLLTLSMLFLIPNETYSQKTFIQGQYYARKWDVKKVCHEQYVKWQYDKEGDRIKPLGVYQKCSVAVWKERYSSGLTEVWHYDSNTKTWYAKKHRGKYYKLTYITKEFPVN